MGKIRNSSISSDSIVRGNWKYVLFRRWRKNGAKIKIRNNTHRSISGAFDSATNAEIVCGGQEVQRAAV